MAISRRRRHDTYTASWIGALHEELTAAKSMLDERPAALSQPKLDYKSYIYGEISSHKALIACFPSGEYGIHAAALVATQM
ncbi:hypothetical protein BJX68DRAFT_246142 [Aspergillus pseudodeflectus]|uniref:Uncharacterized protein n=1 Tax=Aspergillus pseudodeflectus TaxID=176178 RepID=A0ABR4JME8_9EURO